MVRKYPRFEPVDSPDHAASESPSRHIVFVDATVDYPGHLLSGLAPLTDAILLHADRPALGQIREALARCPAPPSALHILAHGASGRIAFGAGEFSAATLSRDAADLAAIGQALDDGVPVQIWSCGVAQGGAGRAFVDELSHRLARPVAAASEAVGAVEQGGSWHLDYLAGSASVASPLAPEAMRSYPGLLQTDATTNAVDTIVQTIAADTLTITNTLQLQATDFFDGKTGIDTLLIGGAAGVAVNLSGLGISATAGLHNFEALTFNNSSGESIATFDAAQFGAGLVANTLAVNGAVGFQTISIKNALNFSAAAWTFTDWAVSKDSISITGTGGNDTLVGAMLDSTVNGGGGNDSVIGGAGNDTLQGGTGADILAGGAGSDNLDGGSDNDTLQGGIGLDILDGGLGTDTLSYAASAGAVNISLATNAAGGNDAAGDTISNFENILGSAFADKLTGDGGVNVLSGGGGNDVLDGGAGGDRIDGGAGVDILTYAGSGLKVIVNLATGTGSGGFAGGDTITNIENVTGSALDDRLTGNALVNLLSGGAGNDTIEGGAGGDTLDGVAGLDTLSYAASAAAVNVNLFNAATSGGDAAGDKISNFDNATGSVFADRLTGNDAANTLFGGGGDDILEGGDDADRLEGGTGSDTASYAAADSRIIVNLLTGIATGSDSTGDVFVNIENLTGSAFDDRLAGGDTANILLGGAGNDTLEGGKGGDTLNGGVGIDTIYYGLSAAGVNISLALGTASGGEAAGDIISGVENITGSALNDMLSGNGLNNTLLGGTGNDIIAGGGGADTLDGGLGIDTVDYAASFAGVSVSLLTDLASGGTANGDTIIGFENVTGTALNDTLTGDGGSNILVGGNGDDLLEGGAGGDVLSGGNGIDTMSYAMFAAAVTVNLATGLATGGAATGDTFSGIENITGSGGDDTLTGDALANVLKGGDGNDLLQGAAGADTLDGGAGNNTLSYANSNAAVIVNLASSGVNGGHAAGDKISNFTNLIGSAFNDRLTGNAEANDFVGGAGNDTVIYSASATAVSINLVTGRGLGGAAEGDTYDGIESVIGSAFGDLMASSAGANTLSAGLGIDTLTYGGSTAGVAIDLSANTAAGGFATGDVILGFEIVIGSNLSDQLTGSIAANTLIGASGADLIAGLAGADTLDGGLGIDMLSYAASAAHVEIDLGAGTAASGDAAGDIISNFENVTGTVFSDRLAGNAADNILLGGNGNDLFTGGAGDDTLDGGAGIDTVTYALSAARVIVDLGDGSASGGDANGDILVAIENITGSDFDDRLTGNGAANILLGGAHNDALDGGAGGDKLDGGAGIDTLSYAGSGALVLVNLATRAVSGGDAAGDIIFNFENVLGSAFNDNLTGNAAANSLFGDVGDDTLEGGGGGDTLNGGAGSDTVSYAQAGTGVTIDLAAGTFSRGDAEGDLFVSIENITGSAFDDTFAGNGFANVLNGGGGIDTLSYAGTTAAVTLNLDTGAASGGNAQGDVISGFENLLGTLAADNLTGAAGANFIDGGLGSDDIFGLAGNDTLYGGSGNDDLQGGDGDDILWGSTNADVVGTGGSGHDTMDGGAGRDTFLYTSVDESGVQTAVDIVNNFQATFDRFDFVQIDAQATSVGNQSFSFIGTAKFSAEGQIRVFQFEDYAVIEVNTVGTGGAEMQIALFNHNANSVTAFDFIL